MLIKVYVTDVYMANINYFDLFQLYIKFLVETKANFKAYLFSVHK